MNEEQKNKVKKAIEDGDAVFVDENAADGLLEILLFALRDKHDPPSTEAKEAFKQFLSEFEEKYTYVQIAPLILNAAIGVVKTEIRVNEALGKSIGNA